MKKHMPPLPRQLSSSDPREVISVVRQIVDYLHALPRFELKKVTGSTVDADGYLTVSTKLKHPYAMLLGQIYETESPDDVVSHEERALPDWRPVEGGLKHRIDTSEANVTLHYVIIGEGE